MIRTLISAFVISLLSITAYSQTKEVLFLGNSYTGNNDLPAKIKAVALSVGDTLIYQKSTPGGYSLISHDFDQNSKNLIKTKKWDHVVLQAQSQETAFNDYYLENNVYPHAKSLCERIRNNDSCTRPIFYMTWGRENGDHDNCFANPILCTYEGMDSMINLRYRIMGNDNDAFVSPVGAVWHYIRDNYPGIDLYTADESHPTLRGTYVAAVTFYTVLFRKDPTLITENFSISSTDAENIRKAAKLVVFDSLKNWNVGVFDPVSSFTSSVQKDTVSFTSNSKLTDSYYWDFGDGRKSNEESPTHVYWKNGSFKVTLISKKCGITDTMSKTIVITGSLSIDDLKGDQVLVYPNPASNSLIAEGLNQKFGYKITDINGRIVLYSELIHYNTIDISSLDLGLYFLQVLNENGTTILTQKIFKE